MEKLTCETQMQGQQDKEKAANSLEAISMYQELLKGKLCSIWMKTNSRTIKHKNFTRLAARAVFP